MKFNTLGCTKNVVKSVFITYFLITIHTAYYAQVIVHQKLQKWPIIDKTGT